MPSRHLAPALWRALVNSHPYPSNTSFSCSPGFLSECVFLHGLRCRITACFLVSSPLEFLNHIAPGYRDTIQTTCVDHEIRVVARRWDDRFREKNMETQGTTPFYPGLWPPGWRGTDRTFP